MSLSPGRVLRLSVCEIQGRRRGGGGGTILALPTTPTGSTSPACHTQVPLACRPSQLVFHHQGGTVGSCLTIVTWATRQARPVSAAQPGSRSFAPCSPENLKKQRNTEPFHVYCSYCDPPSFILLFFPFSFLSPILLLLFLVLGRTQGPPAQTSSAVLLFPYYVSGS